MLQEQQDNTVTHGCAEGTDKQTTKRGFCIDVHAHTHTTNSFSESTTRHGPQEPTSQEQATFFFCLRHHRLGTSVSGSARHCQREPGSPHMPNRSLKTPGRHLCGETGGASLLHSASVRKPFLQFVHRNTLNGGTSSSRTARNDAHKRATENDNVVSQRGSARCDVQKRETGNDNVVREHGKC